MLFVTCMKKPLTNCLPDTGKLSKCWSSVIIRIKFFPSFWFIVDLIWNIWGIYLVVIYWHANTMYISEVYAQCWINGQIEDLIESFRSLCRLWTAENENTTGKMWVIFLKISIIKQPFAYFKFTELQDVYDDFLLNDWKCILFYILKRLGESAAKIQAQWRGYNTRKKLRKADKSFTKFQKSFRYIFYCTTDINKS